MQRTRFIGGDWNVIDDRTGFKKKRSECQMTWDNLLVEKKFWAPRQPQDFVRGRKDKQTVGLTRPEQQDRFLNVGDVSPEDL